MLIIKVGFCVFIVSFAPFKNLISKPSKSVLIKEILRIKDECGIEIKNINIGGGLGVKYTNSDIPPSIEDAANIIIRSLNENSAKYDLGYEPTLYMEPGRSIVADAGMTLYTVGTVKKIPGYKNYASIDGGMTDNPRYALYESKYTVLLANRMEEEKNFTCDVVGRCCESGDIIQPAVTMPEPNRGDIVAVCTTGAYNYSMASNYNRVPRPPVVMLRSGESYIAVKRETYADLLLNDI